MPGVGAMLRFGTAGSTRRIYPHRHGPAIPLSEGIHQALQSLECERVLRLYWEQN